MAGEKKNIKQTKKVCTTTCFYLIVVTPAGLPEKAIIWPFTLEEHHNILFFKNILIFKHTNYSHYIILPN